MNFRHFPNLDGLRHIPVRPYPFPLDRLDAIDPAQIPHRQSGEIRARDGGSHTQWRAQLLETTQSARISEVRLYPLRSQDPLAGVRTKCPVHRAGTDQFLAHRISTMRVGAPDPISDGGILGFRDRIRDVRTNGGAAQLANLCQYPNK